MIAYEGGVSLWNIAEKREERSWEISLPPGAPGGGNDEEEKLFSERRLNVTCLAWRPDGMLSQSLVKKFGTNRRRFFFL